MSRGDTEAFARLFDSSEVTVAVTTGTAERSGLPTNPFVSAEVNVSDTATVHSQRKPSTGGFYDQQAHG